MTISCHFFVWLNAHRNSILRQFFLSLSFSFFRQSAHAAHNAGKFIEKDSNWWTLPYIVEEGARKMPSLASSSTSLFVQRGNYLSITANVYFCLECNVGFVVSWFIVVKVKPFWSKSPVYWLVIMVFRVHFTQPQPKNGPKTWNRIVLDGKLFMSGWTLFAAPLSPAVNVILISTLPLISFSLYFLTVIVR